MDHYTDSEHERAMDRIVADIERQQRRTWTGRPDVVTGKLVGAGMIVAVLLVVLLCLGGCGTIRGIGSLTAGIGSDLHDAGTAIANGVAD